MKPLKIRENEVEKKRKSDIARQRYEFRNHRLERAKIEAKANRKIRVSSKEKRQAIADAIARIKAKELEDALAVLSSFDEGPDLVLYYKYLMVLNGDKAYELHFNSSDKLSDSQKGYAKSQYELFKKWYASWNE